MKMCLKVIAGVLVAMAALLGVLAFGGKGHAQYPPPTGNMTLVAGTTSPVADTTVSITATVRNLYGSGVEGVACTFSIVSQPGTDASVEPGPVTTDVNGEASTTLSTGTTLGTIVVRGVCGEYSSRVSVLVRAAAAEGPPPTGNVTLVAGTTNPVAGTTVPITATVSDQYGSAVAGVACTFSIVSQPGTDASVAPGPVTTDVNGAASTSLNTGTTLGTVVVGAICGEFSSQVSVLVGAPAAAAPVGLPSTGGGEAGMPAGVGWMLAIVAAIALGSGAMLAVVTVRRARAVRR